MTTDRTGGEAKVWLQTERKRALPAFNEIGGTFFLVQGKNLVRGGKSVTRSLGGLEKSTDNKKIFLCTLDLGSRGKMRGSQLPWKKKKEAQG